MARLDWSAYSAYQEPQNTAEAKLLEEQFTCMVCTIDVVDQGHNVHDISSKPIRLMCAKIHRQQKMKAGTTMRT